MLRCAARLGGEGGAPGALKKLGRAFWRRGGVGMVGGVAGTRPVQLLTWLAVGPGHPAWSRTRTRSAPSDRIVAGVGWRSEAPPPGNASKERVK